MAERTLRGIGRAAPIERIPPSGAVGASAGRAGRARGGLCRGRRARGHRRAPRHPYLRGRARVAAGELADHRGDHEEARRALEDDLDATSPRNKRRYERYGFRATGEFEPRGERHSARCGVSPRIDRRSSRARRHRGRTRLPVSPRRLRLSSTSPKIQTDSLGRGGCRRASGTSSLVLRIAVAQEPSPLRVLRRSTLSALGYTGVFR
jgi:hypothetical protein